MRRTDKEIIEDLTKAGVPRACWSVSVTGTGRAHLRDAARNTLAKATDRAVVACIYLRHNNPDTRYLCTELIAKELVLSGVPTRYTTYHHLARDIRIAERKEEPSALDKIFGIGAIVVPELPPAVEIANEQYNEVVEYLVNHAYQGGTLVVSGSVVVGRSINHWPPAMMRLLNQSATIVEGV